jgi:hypothetical protein
MKDILDQIKLRPKMIINERRLENLHAFMNGYMYCIFQEDDIITDFYPGFQEYIEQYYKVSTGQHWSEIINYYSNNEEAFEKFFRHLEEYSEIELTSAKG